MNSNRIIARNESNRQFYIAEQKQAQQTPADKPEDMANIVFPEARAVQDETNKFLNELNKEGK